MKILTKLSVLVRSWKKWFVRGEKKKKTQLPGKFIFTLGKINRRVNFNLTMSKKCADLPKPSPNIFHLIKAKWWYDLFLNFLNQPDGGKRKEKKFRNCKIKEKSPKQSSHWETKVTLWNGELRIMYLIDLIAIGSKIQVISAAL